MHNAHPGDKRWQIMVCERQTIHIHYGTGSLHIMKEDFVALAKDLRALADRLDSRDSDYEGRKQKQVLQ